MLRQWKCPMCDCYSIREKTTQATIYRYLTVDDWGELEVSEEDISIGGTVSYSCAECDYEIPRSVNNWEKLEAYIGEDTENDEESLP